MSKSFKAACVQMNSAAEIAPNLESASASIRAAAGAGAQLVMTPENTTLIEPNRARARAIIAFAPSIATTRALGNRSRSVRAR